ncbi:peptidase M61 [Muriicola sp.]|uniref:M61 family metallopeptidase n=1 Tax=Muriicola sp. TaxID=2020856 RepID=UPI003C7635C5
MIRKFLILSPVLLLLGCGASQTLVSAESQPIAVSIDLVEVQDDRVSVTIDPGVFSENETYFYIPKIVPGTYSEDNYGKYIDGLTAYDYDGSILPVNKVDDNSWLLTNAQKVDKISYFVNDTFDTETEVEEPVFSPAGTNILKDENFLLNLHGFVGYFKGLKETPYTLTIRAPASLEASTSLQRINTGSSNKGENTYVANRYFEVIDNPILYAQPNSVTFQIKDISVTLSVYSPDGSLKAKDLQPKMETMMLAQKNFLGDINGTKQYTILLYLSQLSATDATGFGALEHHSSTVVVFPQQIPRETLEESMVDVVSHEFFHIVTPLSVHSREIQYFDFNEPKMSMHLWMYEGTTEYFSMLFQIQQGLISEAEFYSRIMDKISNSKGYEDTMSFTTMSKNILVEPYKSNYANVYEKGTLINMCLDILLRELSGGEKGVRWLMKELSNKYDVNTPFNDPDLIDEIISMTYPDISDFFAQHVIGNEPIPYDQYLKKVGLEVTFAEQPGTYFYLGQEPYIDANPANLDAIFIRKGMELNSFFKDLGAKGGDIIKNINGTDITLESMRGIVGQSFGWDADKEISMRVDRNGKLLELKGKAGTPTYKERSLDVEETPSAAVLALREAWLKK